MRSLPEHGAGTSGQVLGDSKRRQPGTTRFPGTPTRPLVVGIVLTVFGLASAALPGCDRRAPVVDATRGPERDRARRELQERIARACALPFTDSTETEWRTAFWAMQFTRDTSSRSREALRRAWSAMAGRSVEFQRALLEVAITLCPDSFRSEALAYLDIAPNEKLFAMSAWIVRAVPGPLETIHRTMQARFPGWRADPILSRLALSFEPLPGRPPLVDLLRTSFEEGVPIVFSFQRHRRVYPGIAVVRLPSGKFLREEDGRLFVVSQLALSLSNLPGFLTNGNTPQGVLTMQGTAVSGDEYIGPTTTLLLKLPFEAGPGEYFHGRRTDTTWTPLLYAALLPAAWQAYHPMAEAYDAGRAGRFDILAHGTTIDPSYYRGERFYPHTPSLGCLCAPERWSPVSGERIASEQQRLIDALARHGGARGYVVVVELDDESRPVDPGDVLPEIVRAEAGP